MNRFDRQFIVGKSEDGFFVVDDGFESNLPGPQLPQILKGLFGVF